MRKTLTETLREAIRKSGLSVAEIARRTDITQPVLCRFANGRRDLHLRTADRLAVYFGLTLRPEKQPAKKDQ